MRIISFLIAVLLSTSAFSQHEGDTLYKRCPVSIKDTATGNDYFIEHQQATVKTYKSNGNLNIVIEQKNQFFTMVFRVKKLSTKGKYVITPGANNNNELTVKYSFRSGESVAFIDVSSGKVETSYDKTIKLWHIKLTGLIANMGDTRVTYFKAKADFYVK
jgi:hypothetical protein